MAAGGTAADDGMLAGGTAAGVCAQPASRASVARVSVRAMAAENGVRVGFITVKPFSLIHSLGQHKPSLNQESLFGSSSANGRAGVLDLPGWGRCFARMRICAGSGGSGWRYFAWSAGLGWRCLTLRPFKG